MKRLISGLVLFGVLVPFSFALHHYPPHAKSKVNETTVHVVWLEDYETVDLVCSYISRSVPKGEILGCYWPVNHTIYAVEPTSFNDRYGLHILGHEFWHALGADHP